MREFWAVTRVISVALQAPLFSSRSRGSSRAMLEGRDCTCTPHFLGDFGDEAQLSFLIGRGHKVSFDG